jgi:phosphatidylserine/phosphatidylglycerophosphate/cardiolipin synthase-like enzyme
MEKYLIDEINLAEQSIYIASYDGALTTVMKALIDRKKAKPDIDIRWVTDDTHCKASASSAPSKKSCNPGFLLLTGTGIEVRSDVLPKGTTRNDPTPLMHDKFIIFDGKIVWTGSTNLTYSGVFVQHNNTVVIESADLAKIYKAEFDEMWDEKFGTDSPPQAEQSITLADSQKTKIGAFFTPDSSDPGYGSNAKTATAKSIIPLVDKATQNIYFMAYSFTDDKLAQAIIQRAKGKVQVKGIFDGGQKKTDDNQNASEIDGLACAKNVNIALRRDWTIMHSKVIIIDGKYVITGSLNFSTRANKENDENVVIIDSPKLAALYIKEFNRIWDAKNPNDNKDATLDYKAKCP